MDTEDFSFPKIGGTCAYSIDLPPLWNISPKDPSNPNQVPREGSKGDEKDCFEAKLISKGHRKSFSCVEDGKKITRVDHEAAPMDLLWEVFNEELSSATEFSSTSSREMVEFRCATTALTVAKTNKGLLQTKNRPEIAFDKVLQKPYSVGYSGNGLSAASNLNG
ncbi:hypothetical protein JHK87_056813 [Glycine soja]|nr:hypothetical protein JHK87_056813 [Glycine soja]